MEENKQMKVTQDSFALCWEQIDILRRKARVMGAIASYGGFLTNLLLLLMVIAAANGLIYEKFSGSYPNFLRSIPQFASLWDAFSGFLLKPTDSMLLMSVKLLLAVYILCILFFGMLSLLIRLVYHPRRQPLGDGTYEENTALLVKATQDARASSYKTRLSTSMVAAILAIIACCVLLFAYTIHMEDAQLIEVLLSRFPTNNLTTNCMLYAVFGYLICGVLSFPLLLASRFIYRYEFPMELVIEAERAAMLAKEEFPDLPPEDLEKHYAEAAVSLREEAISLEKEGSYGAAKVLLHKAALLGDFASMEHYARHCLILHMDDSARCWLEQVIASGKGTKEAQRMLRRLKLRLGHRTQYLRQDTAPATTWQKIWRVAKQIIVIAVRIALLVLFVLFSYIFYRLVQSNLDPKVVEELLPFLK